MIPYQSNSSIVKFKNILKGKNPQQFEIEEVNMLQQKKMNHGYLNDCNVIVVAVYSDYEM